METSTHTKTVSFRQVHLRALKSFVGKRRTWRSARASASVFSSVGLQGDVDIGRFYAPDVIVHVCASVCMESSLREKSLSYYMLVSGYLQRVVCPQCRQNVG